MCRWLCTVLVVSAPLALLAQPPTKTIEDGVLDRIELFDAPTSADALTVVVRPFDAAGADLGTGGGDGKPVRQEEARTIQAEGPRMLADTLIAAVQESRVFKGAVVAADGDALPEGALIVVEGTFMKIDPGSRAKRYFAGFGAGKSSVEVAGTVSTGDGKLLARFRQRRIGTMGMAGGDSLGKLKSDTRNIGKDIGKFLAAWAANKDLDD